EEPILPLGVFANPTVRLVGLSSFGIGAIYFPLTIYIPLYAQGVLSASATRSGLFLVPMNVSWVITSAVVGHRVARHGRYKRFPVRGALTSLMGIFLLGLIGGGQAEKQALIGAVAVLIGCGLGMTWQTMVTAAQNAVHRSQLGGMTGTTQ